VKFQAARIFADELCSPVALVRAFDNADRDWRDWEPETLWSFFSVPNQQALRDKILAAQVVVTNPDVLQLPDLFTHVNSAFNHRQASFEWLDLPEPAELAWTLRCLRALGKVDIEAPVKKFIEACFDDAGVLGLFGTGLTPPGAMVLTPEQQGAQHEKQKAIRAYLDELGAHSDDPLAYG
jgi:hypothetical protein